MLLECIVVEELEQINKLELEQNKIFEEYCEQIWAQYDVYVYENANAECVNGFRKFFQEHYDTLPIYSSLSFVF